LKNKKNLHRQCTWIKEMIDTKQRTLNYLTELVNDLAENHDLHKSITLLAEELGSLPKTDHLVFTGVGKAGDVAKCAASKFNSNGFPSVFLCPMNALHGDLGVVTRESPIIFFSNSGNTKELVDLRDALLRLYSNHKPYMVVITQDYDCELTKGAESWILYGKTKEIGPFGYTPNVSTTKMLMVSDIVLAQATEIRNSKGQFIREDYFKRHHSGYLGKKAKEDLKKETKMTDSQHSVVFKEWIQVGDLEPYCDHCTPPTRLDCPYHTGLSANLALMEQAERYKEKVKKTKENENEEKLGIPEQLEALKASIFKGLPIEKAMLWPERFLDAFEPGKDYSKAWHKFAIWILVDPQHGTIKHATQEEAEAIRNVANLHQQAANGIAVPQKDWKKAADAANVAADASYDTYAAYVAANTAAAVYVANAYVTAVYVANVYAANVAGAAHAYANAHAAAYANARAAAHVFANANANANVNAHATAAAGTAYEVMADKLIEIIKGE
jgi:arabinose-5-phosphate isomerase